nr:hypothetical protein [Streptococcus macedonicus]
MGDCLSCQPDAVILMVGINYVWHLVGKDGLLVKKNNNVLKMSIVSFCKH